MLKKISEKIGFTETEIKVVLFLIIIFIIGFGVKYFVIQKENEKLQVFDYTKQDSLFEYSGIQDSSHSNKEIANKVVDYKQEVLDFNEINFKKNKKDVPPEKSLNINTASIEDLIKLPGIGKVTAGNIIRFRDKISKFGKLEEILKVKGIGTSKFNKIKKYLYIE